MTVYPEASYLNISASQLVQTGSGRMYGFFVNSYTATATVKFWDALTATTPVLLNTIIIDRVGFYEVPGGTYGTGLFCTIATAAADITVFYSALSLIHISEPTRRHHVSRMPSSA